MASWPASSARSATPIPGSEALLRLRRLPGRQRARRHLALSGLALGCGWFWLGWDGAVLLTLWWWSLARLARTAPVKEEDAFWEIDPARVRRLLPGHIRTRLVVAGGGLVEIFHDELSAADLARLRRELKAQLAAG